MVSVQSFIRTEVSRGTSPVPRGVEAFRAYAIASAKGLIPEMENAARQTLEHPMTFEILGEGLQLFEGWALCDLVQFRRRCGDNLVTCLDSFLKVQPPGPSSFWVGCPEHVHYDPYTGQHQQGQILPKWLSELLSLSQNNLNLQKFTEPLDVHSTIREKYLKAFHTHLHCNFCLKVHAEKGMAFCAELENKLARACDKVTHSIYLSSPTRFTSRRYAEIAGLLCLTNPNPRNRVGLLTRLESRGPNRR